MERPRQYQEYRDCAELECDELLAMKEHFTGRDDYDLIAGRIDRELRQRYNDLGNYIDKRELLTPEQREMTSHCLDYKLGLHAVRRVVSVG